MSPKKTRSSKTINIALSGFDKARLEQRLKTTAISLQSIDVLVLNPRNAKRHPERQIALLAENIRRFGFTQPIIIDEKLLVLAGHGRLAAARRLAMKDVPTIQLKYLSAEEKRLLALADNKLSELGEWDLDVVAAELKELTELSNFADDSTFDIDLSGFDTVEVDRIVENKKSKNTVDPVDVAPIPSPDPSPVTAFGDVWRCGNHVLICDNALHASAYRKLLGEQRAKLVFADPPYNVRISGHVSKRKGVREFAMASGEMSSDEFISFLRTVASLMADNVDGGAVLYICMDWAHLDELQTAARHSLGSLKNLVVWVKNNAGMGTFYRSQHELIAVYVTKGGTATNNFGLGERGRYRTNVWNYPGVNTLGDERDKTLAMHPTVKPVALVSDALRDCSNRGDIVLDPFGGSGTTLIAAEKTGRYARLIEIDPIYCDVIIRRYQEFSKQDAIHVESGETFSQRATKKAVAEDGELK